MTNHWGQTCVPPSTKTRIRDSLKEPAHVFYWFCCLTSFFPSLNSCSCFLFCPQPHPIPQRLIPSLHSPRTMHSHNTKSNPTSPSIILPSSPYFFQCLRTRWGSSLWDVSVPRITCGAFSIQHLCLQRKLCKSYFSPPFISKGWITAEEASWGSE